MELLGFGGMRGGKVVTGAPFSAVATAESKHTLADGTVVSHKVETNLFRDAQGRVRREVTMQGIGPGMGGASLLCSYSGRGSGMVTCQPTKVANKCRTPGVVPAQLPPMSHEARGRPENDRT
jgi:hypothetical protein